MVYKWKVGTRIKADPETALAVMNDLAARNTLDAQTLVDESRPEDAPLHNEFEWDDQKAAEEFRKAQARCIINALVEVDETQEGAEPIRCFFQIDKNTSLYEPIGVIVQNEDKMKRLQEQAYSELQAYSRKYSTIIIKCGAEAEIANLQGKLGA